MKFGMKFGIDFDGTCVEHKYPTVGQDNIGAVEVLLELSRKGYKLILNTMRSDQYLNDAVQWFAKNKIPLYGINKDPDQIEWTNSPKVYSNYYIDDAALGCPLIIHKGFSSRCVDWAKIRELLVNEGVL